MKEGNFKESDFIFYKDNSKNIKVHILLGDETVWATQKGMSEIFGVDRSVITKHLQNIFQEGELDENSVSAKNALTANDGKIYQTQFYNLDAIISVGYRVNSYQATQFRIWATSVLKEYIIKGFALDDDRLKQGSQAFGKDYFHELLERIREIRASERRFYQKITDLYAQASIDYDADSSVTHEFYAIVQNKLHYAVTEHTAAEIIKLRASANKPHMGLTNWRNGPDGKILKPDVSVAKNYLTQDEIGELNIVVNMYLDYAELQAKKKIPMKMIDWIAKLDAFLKFNDYDILIDSGTVSAKFAKSLAEREFEKFRVTQDREYESDFDKTVDQIKATGKLPMSTPSLSELLKKEKDKRNAEISAQHERDFNEIEKNYLESQQKKSEFDKTLGAIMKVPKPEK